jgi:hypothetical protein
VFRHEAVRRAPDFLRTPPELASRAVRTKVGSYGFQVATILQQAPTQNGPAEAKAEYKQIPEFGCSACLVGRAEAKFAHRIFGRGGFTGVCASTAQIRRKKVVCEKDGLLLISVIVTGLPVNHRSPARAVVACSLSSSESIRERRARRGFAASRRKSSRNSGRSNGSKHFARKYFCLDAYFSCIAR